MLERLKANRSGNIPIIVGLLAVPLVVFAGSGIDLMLHERERSELQNSLDRGVLAAASLTQTKPVKETIEGYINAAGLTNYTLTFNSQITLNSRTISAEATLAAPTNFLSLLGIDVLDVHVRSKAEERRQKIEISLVLDLSGSMRLPYGNSRMAALRPAAKSFISRLIRADTKDFTSMSLIPYAGQVSIGKTAFDSLTVGAGTRKHDKSSCFGNLDTTFSAAIPNFKTAEHVSQFSTWLINTNDNFDPWNCPTEETSITFLSNDAAKLTAEIDKYHMFDGTATQIAMKWGLHLLDPAFKPSLTQMAGHGGPTVPAVFADRPAPFNDGETLKVIVLMTDGEVVAQQRMKVDLIVNPQPTKSGTTKEVLSQSKAISMLVDACNAAKLKNVLIYAIGFDVNTASPTFLEKLRACASSPSNYYDAKTSNIDSIFQNIAGSIERVHLVSY